MKINSISYTDVKKITVNETERVEAVINAYYDEYKLHHLIIFVELCCNQCIISSHFR